MKVAEDIGGFCPIIWICLLVLSAARNHWVLMERWASTLPGKTIQYNPFNQCFPDIKVDDQLRVLITDQFLGFCNVCPVSCSGVHI
jgi:hypothetical protein